MKKLLFLILFMPVMARGQIITTIAGNGTAGYSGDNGPATDATVTPLGVAVDSAGNVYIAQELNNCVRKVSPSGIITTIAGNGTQGCSGDGGQATGALLGGPYEVAVDNAGNIFMADEGCYSIRKIAASGIITTVAGNGTGGYSGDGGPATAAMLYNAHGIAVDHLGRLYIADESNNRVRMVDTAGIITTVAGNGTPGFSGDSGPAIAAELLGPYSVAVDSIGNVYVGDLRRVRKVDINGIITTVAGCDTNGYFGDGVPATIAQFGGYFGVQVDNAGNIYIADGNNDRIRKVNTSGIINTIAGPGTPGHLGDGGNPILAELAGPSNVALDANGNIYIADANDNRIRFINYGLTWVNNISSNPLQVKAFPNPATVSLTITSTEKITSVVITNLIGQTVYTNECNTPQLRINVTDLPPGIYFVKLNNTEVRKFVKE